MDIQSLYLDHLLLVQVVAAALIPFISYKTAFAFEYEQWVQGIIGSVLIVAIIFILAIPTPRDIAVIIVLVQMVVMLVAFVIGVWLAIRSRPPGYYQWR